MEERNPWGRKSGDHEGSINLMDVWRKIKETSREKYNELLIRNRERFRQAWRYKDKKITEAELYDEVAKMDD